MRLDAEEFRSKDLSQVSLERIEATKERKEEASHSSTLAIQQEIIGVHFDTGRSNTIMGNKKKQVPATLGAGERQGLAANVTGAANYESAAKMFKTHND